MARSVPDLTEVFGNRRNTAVGGMTLLLVALVCFALAAVATDRRLQPVSYTHLDVYKRQPQVSANPPNSAACAS